MTIYVGDKPLAGLIVAKADNETIIFNSEGEFVTIGNQTKDGQLNYDWMGTMEEYQTAVQQGIIQDNWTCFITDYQSEDAIDIIRRAKANLPYVLLEPKWFEQNPQNASWLESDGSFKDGTVYTDAYDALATELDSSISIGTANENGYVKRGLPVVDSNDTYTDYDYVINQTAHTFRLPTKVNIAAGSAVVGNGMTLGLTNGTQNAGLYVDNALYGRIGNYGSNIGSSSSGSYFSATATAGITTDGSKSGIITDTTGLVLCFYVGDIVTDLQIVNGGAVLTSLDNKVNRDLTNLPNSSKSEIAGYGMPSGRYVDLTLGASGSTYTAPANGWFCFYKNASAGAQRVIVSTTTMRTIWTAVGSGTGVSFIQPVQKGEQMILDVNLGLETQIFRFVYAEGSEND